MGSGRVDIRIRVCEKVRKVSGSIYERVFGRSWGVSGERVWIGSVSGSRVWVGTQIKVCTRIKVYKMVLGRSREVSGEGVQIGSGLGRYPDQGLGWWKIERV